MKHFVTSEFSAQLSVYIKYFGSLTVVSNATTILNIITIISNEFVKLLTYNFDAPLGFVKESCDIRVLSSASDVFAIVLSGRYKGHETCCYILVLSYFLLRTVKTIIVVTLSFVSYVQTKEIK